MRPFKDCFAGLLASLRPLRFKLLLRVAIGLMQVGVSLTFVWCSKYVVDIATGQRQGRLAEAAVLFAGILLLQIVLRIAASYWEGYVVVGAQNDMRRRVFTRAMRSVWNGKERFHSGDATNRLEEDIRVVVDFLCVSVPAFFVTLCQFAAACVFLFMLSPRLGLILVFIMPMAVVGSRLFFRKMRAITGEIRAGDSRVQAQMQESLQHRMTVKAMGGTDRVLSEMDDTQNYVRSRTITRLNYSALSRTILQLGFTLGYASAFIWSVYGISEGKVTYGLMTAFLQLVGQVQRPIADISMQIPKFIRALSSEDRLLELSEQTQEESPEDIRLEGAPGVRLESLSFRYEGEPAPVFENLSFDFRPGTMTAVLGPTGSGKSTLIKVIMALLKPSSGSVSLYPPETASSEATRCNFMYVPQGNSLMSGTIRENLLLAKPDAGEEEITKALSLAAADFVKDLPLGIETVCAEVGAGLSEGQAQRIAIARALLRPGGVLVLDEATSALDADTEDRLLKRLAAEFRGSKTIICITHRPAATQYADYTLNMA